MRLSNFRGKKVILYFYPEDFTSGCELQACKFRDAYPQIEDANAVVLGISPAVAPTLWTASGTVSTWRRTRSCSRSGNGSFGLRVLRAARAITAQAGGS